ncbi:MAG: hypothetical protein GYA20_00615 [Chloroflexi bacterium]|nr:hypothetical protein [Chloroflexota bacterium]
MEAKKKPSIKKIIIIGVVGLVFLCILVAILSGNDQKATDSSENDKKVGEIATNIPSDSNETKLPQPTKTTAPTKTPEPTKEPTATPDPNSIRSGVYLVNEDILPGIYKGNGSCYWERLKDLSGSFDAIIANGNSNGQFYVEVKESDKAFSITCDATRLEALPEPPNEFPNAYISGQYLVGIDIPLGIYRGEGSCYWERQKDVAGGFDAIIANGNSDGQFYVELKQGDFAFSTSCDVVPLEAMTQPTGELPTKIEPGMYLIGRDILPGTYRGEGTCYWERLKDVSGGFQAIIANGNSDGQFYVQISQSDFAFSTNCEVERTGD